MSTLYTEPFSDSRVTSSSPQATASILSLHFTNSAETSAADQIWNLKIRLTWRTRLTLLAPHSGSVSPVAGAHDKRVPVGFEESQRACARRQIRGVEGDTEELNSSIVRPVSAVLQPEAAPAVLSPRQHCASEPHQDHRLYDQDPQRRSRTTGSRSDRNET